MPRSLAVLGTRGYPSYYGGFETAVRRLAPHLVEAGWDVTVYGRPGATVDDAADRDPRVRTVVTSGWDTRSLSTLSHGLSATRDAVRRAPDVALVMNAANGLFLPLLARAGIPTLVNVDGMEWEREKWGPLARSVFRTGARMTAAHATELAFDAHEIARRWSTDFQRDGVFLPYGGDVPPALPVEPGLRHRSYALVVARFVPENTIAEFFAAAPEIARTHDVVIVGSTGCSGVLDVRAERLAAAHERIHYLGHLRDDARLFSLWQHAGAYFHGHSVGGTNPALVQAMACGAPVVARDTVYNREVLGEGGVFVAPEAASIAAAVRRMLLSADGQCAASRAALARAREHYTWEAVCSGYEETLAALADGAAPHSTRPRTLRRPQASR
ncbi:glycosyltransferase [Rathayibacter sp. VKM Ac-2835]|uniref:glycosyltransferase n=1 Tax=Rathayibacter sp. VKM Ac-2835 TaxID=2739043 RepID=UPI001566AAFB|nr:glycosyltransferase [Rathayibacter sp. VKM Ac-2835]NRG39798.1 glycosyltransferase [Rathayibacter sp. VKM Ac-2835]